MNNYKRFLSIILFLVAISTIKSASIVETLPLPGYWDGYYSSRLIFDGKNLWVGDDYNGMIRCIDTISGNVLDSINTGFDNIYGLEFDGIHFWVPTTHTNGPYYFYRFDTIGTFIDSVPNPVQSRYLGGITFQDDYLWVARYYPNEYDNLFKTDTTTQTIVDTIPSPGLQPIGITYDGSNLWIAMDDNDGDPEKVYQLDPTSGDTIISFDVPTTRPRGLAWDGKYLWLIAKHPDSLKGRLFKYDVHEGMPEIHLSNNYHDYGIVPLGDSGYWNLNYSNIGTGDLIIDSITITDDAFTWNKAFPETLLPDSSAYTQVIFIPQHYAGHSASLNIHSNDPINPVEIVELEGEGYSSYQDIVIPENSHDFGELWITAKRYWKLRIQNMGLIDLNIDSFKLSSSNFSVSDSTPFSIPATTENLSRVWFLPGAYSLFYDTLQIFSDDPYEPITEVPLSGEGIDVNFDSTGKLIWSYDAEGDIWEHIRSLKVLNDIDGDGFNEILASSENDTLYCIYGNSYQTGTIAWKFIDNPCWTERGLVPVKDLDGDGVLDIAYGTIWGSRKVYALSGADGSIIWSFDTHMYGDGGWVYEVAPFRDITGDEIQEILAATGNDGSNTGPRRIFCLNGLTGTIEWEHQLSNYTGAGVRMIKDINGDTIPEVAAASLNSSASAYNVYLLDGADGSEHWMTNIASGGVWTVIPGTPDKPSDSTDIIAGYSGGVCALAIGDGSISWNRTISGMCIELTKIDDINGNNSPEVIPQGAAVSQLQTIDCVTGNIIWSKNLAGDIYTVVPISDLTNDGTEELAVGTGYSDNYVYLVDAKNGNILYTINAGSPVESINRYPDITDDSFDEILIGKRNGEILMISSGNWTGVDEEIDITDNRNLVVDNIAIRNLDIGYNFKERMDGKIKIIDVQGRVIKERNIIDRMSGILHIDMGEFPAGVYHILLKTKNNNLSEKIILIK